MYCSNRGHDSLAVFKVTEDFQLELASFVSLSEIGVKWPRNFAIIEDEWLLVAGQNTNNMALFRVQEGHKFTHVSTTDVPSPVCVIPI